MPVSRPRKRTKMPRSVTLATKPYDPHQESQKVVPQDLAGILVYKLLQKWGTPDYSIYASRGGKACGIPLGSCVHRSIG